MRAVALERDGRQGRDRRFGRRLGPCCTYGTCGRGCRGSPHPSICLWLVLDEYAKKRDNERWEVVNGHDAARAWLGREVVDLGEPGVLVLKADKLETIPLRGGSHVVSKQHAESLKW